jgi:hypothetical protein
VVDFTNVMKKKVEQDMRYDYILLNAVSGLSGSPMAFDQLGSCFYE